MTLLPPPNNDLKKKSQMLPFWCQEMWGGKSNDDLRKNFAAVRQD
jgi:hypothetical protein